MKDYHNLLFFPRRNELNHPIYIILVFLTLVSLPGAIVQGSALQNTDTLADGGNQKMFEDFFKNWMNKGLTLTEDGKYAEALEAFDNAFRYHPGEQDLAARAWEGRARVYGALERYDESLFASNEVMNNSPEDTLLMASAWITKGTALRYLGRYEESLEAFDQALVVDPENPKIKQLRILTLRLMK